MAWLSGARLRWLQWGEGPVYEDEGERIGAYQAPLQSALQLMRTASQPSQALFERVARLLSTDHPDIIMAISAMASGVELMQRDWRSSEDTPDTPG